MVTRGEGCILGGDRAYPNVAGPQVPKIFGISYLRLYGLTYVYQFGEIMQVGSGRVSRFNRASAPGAGRCPAISKPTAAKFCVVIYVEERRVLRGQPRPPLGAGRGSSAAKSFESPLYVHTVGPRTTKFCMVTAA